MALAPVPALRSRGYRLVPVGLVLLAAIPIVSGALRLTQLGGGPELIPAAARFTGSPIPVILHIVAATVFSLAGAFQFLPGLRRGRRSWHAVAGRVLVPAGFVVAASGLWMATLYPHPVGDGPALLVIRVVFGTAMLTSLVLAVRALMRRSYVAHGAWMTRAYALGVAAGTQAIALIPGSILFGSTDETSRAVAMGGAWVVNVAVAELVIRRRTMRAAAPNRRPSTASESSPSDAQPTAAAAPDEHGTRYLARAEGRIAYDVRGTGPIMLMVPGIGELRSAYRFVTGPLVEAGHTVVTTDLRGHGDSDCSFSRFGDGPTAGDLEALLEHLGAPAVVVGNSMAAGAAVILAAERPELVSGLVLVGPFVRRPTSDTGGSRLILRLLMARPWAAAVWRAYLPKLSVGSVPADFEDHRRQVVASIRRPGYARAFGLTTRTDHLDAAARIGRVHAPTLVVMGELDPDFPNPGAEADWIAEALHGRAVMIPAAGHYPQSQQPELVASAIVEFLSKVDTRG